MISVLWIILAMVINMLMGCKKYLDAKPDKQKVVAQSIQDAQALLDNYSIMNEYSNFVGDISDDNYYWDDTYYNSIGPSTVSDSKNYYMWDKEANAEYPWIANMGYYRKLYTVNIAMETVDKNDITAFNVQDWKLAKGGAFFFRANILFHIAEYYAEPYEKNNSLK